MYVENPIYFHTKPNPLFYLFIYFYNLFQQILDLTNELFDLGTGRVMFRLSDILGCFSLGRVLFDSNRFRVNQFLVKYARHAKTSNFVENSGSSIVRLWSIQVSGPFSSERISDIMSNMSLDRSFEFRMSGQFCHVQQIPTSAAAFAGFYHPSFKYTHICPLLHSYIPTLVSETFRCQVSPLFPSPR